MSRRSRVGELAEALYAAEERTHALETEVTDFLDSLYPSSASQRGWRGWQFDRTNRTALGIKIYDVLTPSPAAASALHRAGFVVVVAHDHGSGRFLTCNCVPQIARRIK